MDMGFYLGIMPSISKRDVTQRPGNPEMCLQFNWNLSKPRHRYIHQLPKTELQTYSDFRIQRV
jgi:hypothetical protein